MTNAQRKEAKDKGEKFFTTDKPCFRNHKSKRYVSTGSCVDCQVFRNIIAHKERLRPKDYNKALKLKVYGLTVQAFDKMLEDQNNKCAVCGNLFTDKGNRYACVDHCHDTGKVRGLLCVKCNSGIGLLGDSIKMLEKAIQYLHEQR